MQGIIRYLLNAIVVVGLSVAIIRSMSLEFFSEWAGYLTLCGIPALVMLTIFVHFPMAASGQPQPQPAKGLKLLGAVVLTGALLTPSILYLLQGGIGVPSVVTMMFTIFSVLTIMWCAIVFEGWPCRLLSGNNWLSGFATLALSYVIAYFIFPLLFNFSAFGPGPDAVQGLFPAWSALAFSMTTTAIIFGLLTLEQMPLGAFKRFGQPVAGLLTGVFILALASLLMWVATVMGKVDTVTYMVAGPISFLFGVFMVNDLAGGAAFANSAPPARGILRVIASAAVGVLMYLAYKRIMAWIAPGVPAGAPMYTAEMWLANAMLSITFPIIMIYSHFFDGWPLSRLTFKK